MKIRRSVLKDTVHVETYGGPGAYGPLFASSVSVRCNVDNTVRLVRSASGEEVVSQATLLVHPADASLFTPESRVAVDARKSLVISSSPQMFRSSVAFLKVALA